MTSAVWGALLRPVYKEHDHECEGGHCDFLRDFPLESSHKLPFSQIFDAYRVPPGPSYTETKELERQSAKIKFALEAISATLHTNQFPAAFVIVFWRLILFWYKRIHTNCACTQSTANAAFALVVTFRFVNVLCIPGGGEGLPYGRGGDARRKF